MVCDAMQQGRIELYFLFDISLMRNVMNLMFLLLLNVIIIYYYNLIYCVVYMQVYNNSLDPGYVCPITTEPPEVPVKTPCGHIFDRDAIVSWVVNNPTCPCCRAPVDENSLENLANHVQQVANEVIERDSITELRELVQESSNQDQVVRLLDGKEEEAARLLQKHTAEVQDKIAEILMRLTA